MKSKDQFLLEEAYTLIKKKENAEQIYQNSSLKDIISESIWKSNSWEVRIMFAEAYTIGFQSTLVLEEGVLSTLGKAALKPLQYVSKIYSFIAKPVGDFVQKYGYEKTGLKEIDEKTYNAVVAKFDSFIEKFDPKVKDFIKKSLTEAQSFVRNNPIKMALLSVALTTCMSFAGASMLAIFGTACIVRGTIGLLKGEKPIQAFGKSIITGVIGKLIGFAGKEIFKHLNTPDTATPEDAASAKRSVEFLTANTPEGSNEAFRQALEDHIGSNQPITPRALITTAWKKLGMSDEQVEKLMQKSFKNPKYIVGAQEQLDKPVFIITTDDLKEMPLSQFIKTDVFKLEAAKQLGFENLVVRRIDRNFWNNLFKVIRSKGLDPNHMSKEDISSFIEQHKAEPSVLAIDKLRYNLLSSDKHLKNIVKSAGGWAGPGFNYIVVNLNSQTMSMEEFLNQVIPHEATHTTQTGYGFFGKDRYAGDHNLTRLAKDQQSSFGDVKYAMNAYEVDAWSGNIKRLFFQNTNIVLDDENFNEKFEKFKEWVNTYVPKTQLEKRIIKNAKIYLDQYSHRPEKFNFPEILQNVAMNSAQQKASNIA